MLRSILFRGARAPFIPATRVTTTPAALTTFTRHYAAATPKAADPHHPAETHGHAADAHHSHAAAGHHDDHHHDDHHGHKHIDLSDAPYGVLFGEVCNYFIYLILF